MKDKLKKLPKIGKRGWFGVFCVVAGLFSIAGLGKEVHDTRTEQMLNANDYNGAVRKTVDDVSAELQGYSSNADKQQQQGAACLVFGSALIIWGYKKYNPKKTPVAGFPTIDGQVEEKGSLQKPKGTQNQPGSFQDNS